MRHETLAQAGSPRRQAAAESARTKSQVRVERVQAESRETLERAVVALTGQSVIPARDYPIQPIGRMYLYEVAHRDGNYFVESDHLPRGKNLTEADALAGAYQQDDLVAVWELNPAEGSMRNISEDIALAMLEQSEATNEWALSDFIRETLSESDIDEHFSALRADREYCAELASPYLTGRI